MKLYYTPGACSQAVHIALCEIGATFDKAAVDLASHTLADGTNFFDISPRGYVPVLQLDDGSRHAEVASLLQYVADIDSTRALIGNPGSDRRLAVVEWLSFISSELHMTFSPWMFRKEAAESTRQAVKGKLETRFAELDALLSKKDYLAGEYSVADTYAFTVVSWTSFVAMPLTSYPHLKTYQARVAARPRVQQALKAEGLG